MSFNRFKYDGEERKIYDSNNEKTSNYFLAPPLSKEHCLQENPRIMNQRSGVAMPREGEWRIGAGPIDIESDLYNLQRVASRCPSKKYVPESDNLNRLGQNKLDGNDRLFDPFAVNPQFVNFPCANFPTEDTRLINPACNLRGTGLNRFEDLCLDPQYQTMMPGKTNISVRMSTKDNFKPTLDMPTIGN